MTGRGGAGDRPAPPPAARPDGLAAALARTHDWFGDHSGWAPPDPDTLAEWVADGVCRCPDECLVAPDAWCAHGLASWALVLAALDDFDRGADRYHGRP